MNHRYQKEIKKMESKGVSQKLMPLRPTLGPASQAVGAAEGESMARKEHGQRGAHPRDGELGQARGTGWVPVHTSPVVMRLMVVLEIHREIPKQFSERKFSLHSTSQIRNIREPALVSLLPARLRSCRVLTGAVRAV